MPYIFPSYVKNNLPHDKMQRKKGTDCQSCRQKKKSVWTHQDKPFIVGIMDDIFFLIRLAYTCIIQDWLWERQLNSTMFIICCLFLILSHGDINIHTNTMAEGYKKARIYLKIFNTKLSNFSGYFFGTLSTEMFFVIAKQ